MDATGDFTAAVDWFFAAAGDLEADFSVTVVPLAVAAVDDTLLLLLEVVEDDALLLAAGAAAAGLGAS